MNPRSACTRVYNTAWSLPNSIHHKVIVSLALSFSHSLLSTWNNSNRPVYAQNRRRRVECAVFLGGGAIAEYRYAFPRACCYTNATRLVRIFAAELAPWLRQNANAARTRTHTDGHRARVLYPRAMRTKHKIIVASVSYCPTDAHVDRCLTTKFIVFL